MVLNITMCGTLLFSISLKKVDCNPLNEFCQRLWVASCNVKKKFHELWTLKDKEGEDNAYLPPRRTRAWRIACRGGVSWPWMVLESGYEDVLSNTDTTLTLASLVSSGAWTHHPGKSCVRKKPGPCGLAEVGGQRDDSERNFPSFLANRKSPTS